MSAIPDAVFNAIIAKQRLTRGWGRGIPDDVKYVATWGARAIYTGQKIDLLPNRQSWWGSEGDVTCESLRIWISRVGLPYLRQQAPTLSTRENRTVSLDDGRMHIEANPQSSRGYLHIRAWEAATGDAPKLGKGTE
jgi:hypothetical protein